LDFAKKNLAESPTRRECQKIILKMNKIKTFFPFIIFLSIALGVLLGTFLNIPIPEQIGSRNAHKNKLNKLISFIDNEYVDKVDTDSIVDLACSNILKKLDPHSVYVPPAEQEGLAESMKGGFVGIGINFYMYRDSLVVISPLENGPSAKAGILAGDRILLANKVKLFGRKLPSDSVFGNLKGTEGSLIDLTIYRKTTQKTLSLKLKRSVIPIKSVDVGMMINPKTGYIKVNRFAETTFAEFKKTLTDLKAQGMQELVIDLRENGGGYMEEAVQMADEFLKKDELVVFTKNKNGRIDKSFATEKGDFEHGKLYVLIDENSASASEIFAGAIQDNVLLLDDDRLVKDWCNEK
jgi:carboxyl-terminal processing protease